MSIKIKHSSRKLLKFTTLFVIFVLGAGGVLFFTDARVKSKAELFCNSVAPGAAIETLAKTALDSGAKLPKEPWRQSSGSTSYLAAVFTGIDPFYGHICTINASNGLVVSKELTVLDP